MAEIWKDIPGYEGCYQASSLGSVKSLKRKGRINEMIITPTKDSMGYFYVGLHSGGSVKKFSVHVVVAMAFLGHKPDGTTRISVDHINNTKTDNGLKNLQLISHRANLSKGRLGTSKYTGVSWHKGDGNWRATIGLNYKNKHIGSFDNELDASNAYQKALKEINHEL